MTDMYKKFIEPFREDEIEWRVQQSGKGTKGIWAKVLAYVSARAIMDRLDETVGPENWQDEYAPGPGGGVLCRLSIYFGDGNWICKQDVADNSDIEPIKGGVSGAFKRAAVKWGIGRYLYNLEEGWAIISPDGKHYSNLKDENGKRGEAFKWSPPELPAWALPGGSGRPGNLLILEKPKAVHPFPLADESVVEKEHNYVTEPMVKEFYQIVKEALGTEKEMVIVFEHFSPGCLKDNGKPDWTRVPMEAYWKMRQAFEGTGWKEIAIPF